MQVGLNTPFIASEIFRRVNVETQSMCTVINFKIIVYPLVFEILKNLIYSKKRNSQLLLRNNFICSRSRNKVSIYQTCLLIHFP